MSNQTSLSIKAEDEEHEVEILMLNDSITSFDFVIFILQSLFERNFNSASEIAMHIHKEGSAVVGSYSEGIARAKVLAIKTLARDKGFPLQCVVREEALESLLQEEQIPFGWIRAGAHDYRVSIETNDFHSGTRCAALFNISNEPKEFGNLMQTFWFEDYRGKRLRLKLWIKTVGLKGRVQPWMRVDENPSLIKQPFDNFCGRMITGDTGWTCYESVLDVTEPAYQIAFGVLLSGEGRVLIDDISFEIVDDDVPTTDCTCIRGKKARNLNFTE